MVDKEREKQRKREWYQRNKETIRLKKRAYYQKTKSYWLTKTYEWRRKNREKFLHYTRVNSRRLRKEVREAILDKFGRICRKCGFSDVRALHLDHIDGGGYKERKKNQGLKYYKNILIDKKENYQILCANCNTIKKYENREIPVFDT